MFVCVWVNYLNEPKKKPALVSHHLGDSDTVKSEIFARYNFRANAISGNSRGLKFTHFPFWVTIKKLKTNVFIIFL